MSPKTSLHSFRPPPFCRCAALSLVLAWAGGLPPAQAEVVSRASAEVTTQHWAAVKSGGWNPDIVEWDPVQPGLREDVAAAQSELNYATNVESRLTMQHNLRATAAVEKGVTYGLPSKGPSLKVETYDHMEYNGTAIHRDDGAVWQRSVSGLSAFAGLTMDLEIVAPAAQLPHRVIFYWQVDGNITFDLMAPTPPLGSLDSNPLSLYADQLRSTVGFGGALTSPDCRYCLNRQRFTYGIVDGEYLYSDYHPHYEKTATLPPQFIPVAFDVTDATLTNLTFLLSLQSVHDLLNAEYQNVVLNGTVHARFDNSATLLGVQALDADGREMSGFSYRTSDPDLYIPVYSAPVPEPGSALLIGLGLAVISMARRPRRPPCAAEPAALPSAPGSRP